MAELFIICRRPKAELNVIEKFLKLFKISQSLYKNKEYQKALEELKKSYHLLIDIWDEYPKIRTLYLIMKSYFHLKQYSKCLSIQKDITEKILIEKIRENGKKNKKKDKNKYDLFTKIKAKIEIYNLFINFIYDNLDNSIDSLMNVIKSLSENDTLPLEEKAKFFWHFIYNFVKITGITKSMKFKLFKQDYDSMIISEKKEDESTDNINNCIYEPIKKIDKNMLEKYRAFMNSKLKTNMYEILDKEYYFVNFGKTNDRVVEFLQKNMHIYVKENNKVKLVELFQTFIALAKINLKQQFNMSMNEMLYTQKRRIEKFDIIFANMTGAFNHIFGKYFTHEHKTSYSASNNININKLNLSKNLKEIQKYFKEMNKSKKQVNANKKNILTSFDFNSINYIRVPPNTEEMDQKILLLSRRRKEKIAEFNRNLFLKDNKKMNLKLKKSLIILKYPLNKHNCIFSNYIKSKNTHNKNKKNSNFPSIIDSQKSDNKNNIFSFSEGNIRDINSTTSNYNYNKNKNINKERDRFLSINSYTDYRYSNKTKKKFRNSKEIEIDIEKDTEKEKEKEKENKKTNFILRNINNILVEKLIDLFLPIYRVQNNIEAEEEEKNKNIIPRKIDLYKTLKIPKIISSYYPVYIKGSFSVEKQCSYFFYDYFMLIKNLILFGISDGHGKLGHLISGKICTLFPAYLIYIMIEDSLIKDNKDINKEMYKLFKLQEDPKKVKDMNLLRYFFNKFDIDIHKFSIFNDNLGVIKNQIHEASLYSHNDLKLRYNIDYDFSGTSICSCLIVGEILYTINIGDCGILLGQLSSNYNKWEVKSLSKRHTFDDPQEKARIISKGGRFNINRNNNKSQAESLPLVLHDKDKEIDIHGLTVSRSIGDNHAKKFGVSYEPEVNKYILNSNDRIIIIGNNIIWKYLTNQEIIKILGNCYLDGKSAEEAALYLTEIIKNKSQKMNSFKRKIKMGQNSEISNNESKKKTLEKEKEVNKGYIEDIICIVIFINIKN